MGKWHKLNLVRIVGQVYLPGLWSFGAHSESCWALGVSCRWFISTRRRKCRSFLFSLLITTWRPLSRPPSLISRWVGSKELSLWRGHPQPLPSASSNCWWKGELFCAIMLGAFLRIDLQIKCSATMPLECHWGSLMLLLLLCLPVVKSGWEALTSWPVNPLGSFAKFLISSFTSAPLTVYLNLSWMMSPLCPLPNFPFTSSNPL